MAGNPAARYFEAQAPDIKLVWALSIDVLALTALIFFGFILREKHVRAFKPVGTLLIGFFSLFALYQLQRSLNTSVGASLPRHLWLILKFAMASIALFLMVRFQKRGWRLIRAFFLILSPLFAILVINALVLYHTVDLREVGKGRAAGMLPTREDANRVIWMIFDELDQRMVFGARPARIHMTAFNRLRAESIYADHVKTPALDTALAIPALLSGQLVTDIKLNTSKLLIKTGNCPDWKDFNSEPNLFSRARAAGFNTGVSGWHHPYCRVMGNNLSDCRWDTNSTDVISIERYLRSRPLYYDAVYLTEMQALQLPVLQTFQGKITQFAQQETEIASTRFVVENALRMLRNRNLNVVFVHVPIPHPPGIWNRETQSFTLGASTYLDNLQLADKLLGDMRRVLEQTGDWDQSVILVSSDHPYRSFLWAPAQDWQPYVPFLLKLPRQHQAVVYHREFNNVVTADLLLEALERRVRTAPEAVKWLENHITSAPETNKSNCP
jgi:hypothetical protein